ncbi:translation elongation factor Ts [Patescibacteria group bacterium]
MDPKKIKQLREDTGAGVMEAKKILEEFDWDLDKAKKHFLSKAGAKAAKKADRNASDGLVHSYIHTNGKLGSLILVACETDFVAKTEDFQKLVREIAMQVCTEDYKNLKDLLEAEYMRDPSKSVQDYINEVTAKLGEKIEIKKFVKYSISD